MKEVGVRERHREIYKQRQRDIQRHNERQRDKGRERKVNYLDCESPAVGICKRKWGRFLLLAPHFCQDWLRYSFLIRASRSPVGRVYFSLILDASLLYLIQNYTQLSV